MFIICPNHLVFVFFELRKKLVMIAEMFIKTEKGGFYFANVSFKHVVSMHESVKFLCNIGLSFLICF